MDPTQQAQLVIPSAASSNSSCSDATVEVYRTNPNKIKCAIDDPAKGSAVDVEANAEAETHS